MFKPRDTYRFPFTAYPAVRLALLVIAGILLSRLQLLSGFAAAGLSVLLLISTVLLDHLVRRQFRFELSGHLALSYLLFSLSLGLLAGSFQLERQQAPRPEMVLGELFPADTLRWHGHIRDASLNAGGTLSVILQADSVTSRDGSLRFRHGFRTQIRYFRADSLQLATLRNGYRVTLEAIPAAIPQRRNPHDFNVESWLHAQGIFVQATGTGAELRQTAPAFISWGWWRNLMQDSIDEVFSPEQAPLAKAVMLGHRAGLDAELRQNFSRAGLAHLMAVSGMHVGFLLLPFWFLIPVFWRIRYGGWLGLLLIFVLLYLYAGITGFSPSVQRASVFAFFVAMARLFRYQRDPVNLTGLAALIILLADPASLFLIGFQMSFAAVLTIFTLLPVLQQLFEPKKRHLWYAKLTSLTLLSFCIQFALMPVLLHRFNEFSLIGPVMNTLAAPVTQVVFIWGFAGIFLSWIHGPVAAFLTIPADWLALLLAWMTNFAAGVPYAFVQGRLDSLLFYVFWLMLFFTLAALRQPALRFRFAVLCLLAGVMWQGDVLRQKLIEPRGVQLTFFDVGQGDAVLIRTPLGRHYLYDTGLWSPFGNSGDRFILPHLKAEGIRRLDGIFLSHPHSDHIGGLLSIMREIPVDVIYDPGFEHHTALFAGYRRAAAELGIPVVTPKMGDIIWLDELTPGFILGPHPDIRSANPNEHSLILMLRYGQQSVLLTGDAETQAEQLLVRQFGDWLDASVFKAGHHGSRTSSHGFLLEVVQPEKIVVSNALRNRYNHPHPDAVGRMLTQVPPERLHFTALDGAVIYWLDGRQITRVRWRE
ncbi:MAG: DNA internalization-related competence protein ComEC/Rec2 [Balneolales bacterium]|nr:DNA internalization-related competence protein ComEC/Rec2 [Balneolales bacterium]